MFRIDEMARAGGDAPGPEALSLELGPEGVAARESTAPREGSDYVVERALRHMENHLSGPLPVSEIADLCHVSRRTLENAFRKSLGTGPAQEMRRRRMELAKRLLAESDLPLADVAERCGYGGDPRFWLVFRKTAGTTPRDFRQRHRPHQPLVTNH